MSRIDTGEYARINLAGLNQGINLGENADRMRFAQDRAAQADQQQAFQNQAMMGEQAMRMMQIRQRAQAAADKVKAEKRQRQANQFVTKSLMLDDAQFEASREQLSSILPDASPELQRGVFDRKGKLDQIAAGQRHLDSIKASGQKLDERQVKRFEDLGLIVDPSLLMPTLAQKREAEEQEHKDGLVIRGMEQGLIDPSEMEWFMRYATAASLDDELEKRTKAIQAQQEAAAKQTHSAHIGHLIQKKRAGVPLSPQEEGMLVTTPGLSEFETTNKQEFNQAGLNRRTIQDIESELQAVDQQLIELGIATPGSRAGLPVTINKEKANAGAPVRDEDTMWSDGSPATPEYEAAQQLLNRRQSLISERMRVGQQLVPGAVDGKAILSEFERANGRKPSETELADLLRQASQGTPR